MDNFILDKSISSDMETEVYHKNGIWYHDAPKPRRFHRCKPWTYAWYNYFSYVERCACGAIRLSKNGHWMDKNSRR